MKIELKSLLLHAFRNFDRNQKVNFPQNQVTAITGQNRDDGGSNGTGKTGLALAAKVNLYGPKKAGLSVKDLENRYLKDATRLVGEYVIDGQDLIVDRTIGGKFTFKHGDRDWEDGKVDDVQDRLEKLIGLSAEQFSILSSKDQGEYGGFLLMKDSEKKDFLGSFFDVSFIEEALVKADTELKQVQQKFSVVDGKKQFSDMAIKQAEVKVQAAATKAAQYESTSFMEEIGALNHQIEVLESNLKPLSGLMESSVDFNNYVNSLPHIATMRSENEAKFAVFQNQITLLKAQLEEKENQKTYLTQQMRTPLVVPEELLTKKAEAEKAIQAYAVRKAAVVAAKTGRDLALMKINLMKEEAAKKETETCPSCGTPLTQEKREAAVQKVLANLSTLEAQVKEYEEKMAMNEDKESQESVLQELKAAADQEIANFKYANSKDSVAKELSLVTSLCASMNSNLKSLEDSASALQKSVDAEISKIRNSFIVSVSDLQQKITSIRATLTIKQREAKDVIDQYAIAKAELDKAITQAAELQLEKTALEERSSILSDILKITSKNGFVGYIFDNILEDLNSAINENLKMIPNARKFSLQFSSEKIAKTTGAVSKNITYQLFSGEEEVNFDSLSGGEKLSVILSVDEALDSTLGQRLGVSVGWKFLDEQFYWIDENSKEAILDFYKAKSVDRAYFIVDHASEFNAAFDKKIVIVKEQNLAKVL